jgi:hypothetical protein
LYWNQVEFQDHLVLDNSLVELARQTWYAPGSQRELLARIADHYKIEIIENRLVAPKKPIAPSANPDLPF